MPLISLAHWLYNAQQYQTPLNILPSRSEWLDTLNCDASCLHESNPHLSDDCAICFRTFTNLYAKRCRIRLSCGHRHFCKGCLEKWSLEGKTTCPYCRSELWYPHPPTDTTSRPTTGGLRVTRRRNNGASNVATSSTVSPGASRPAPHVSTASQRRFEARAPTSRSTPLRNLHQQRSIPASAVTRDLGAMSPRRRRSAQIWALGEGLDATELQAPVADLICRFNDMDAQSSEGIVRARDWGPFTRSRARLRRRNSNRLRS